MKKYLIIGFAAMALVQWMVPGKMILDREIILNKGTAYKFRTQPVDPYHPFQGRYVALSFAENQFDVYNKNYRTGQDIFIGLRTDDSGYARIYTAGLKAPAGTNDYIKAKIDYATPYSRGATVSDSLFTIYIRYPFSEYYMEEFKAPQAEQAYRELTTDSAHNTYALVKIYKGGGVIQDLVINDKPIREWTP